MNKKWICAHIAGVAAALALAACAGGSTLQSDQSQYRTLSRYGLTIELPAGWHGRIRRFSPDTAPVLSAANFALPAQDDGVGTKAQRLLSTGRIYIAITDLGKPGPHLQRGRWANVTLPVSVGPRDLGAFEGLSVPSLATRWVIVRRHALLVQVAFGQPNPPEAAWTRANAVLARFKVKARR